MYKQRRNAGDTIVEVMIAMAVASLVLGGSFTIVNRTLANARQAQEHGEALKLAQGQVESLKGLFKTNPSLKDGVNDCISAGSVVQASMAQCNNQGTVGYNVSIGYSAVSQASTVTVTWPSVTGQGNDTISQVYRAMQ